MNGRRTALAQILSSAAKCSFWSLGLARCKKLHVFFFIYTNYRCLRSHSWRKIHFNMVFIYLYLHVSPTLFYCVAPKDQTIHTAISRSNDDYLGHSKNHDWLTDWLTVSEEYEGLRSTHMTNIFHKVSGPQRVEKAADSKNATSNDWCARMKIQPKQVKLYIYTVRPALTYWKHIYLTVSAGSSDCF